jgi:UDP-N-acetylmuramoyl-tripeptide--D-alanyl-D-alanine ligase
VIAGHATLAAVTEPSGPLPPPGNDSFDAGEIARLSGGHLVHDAGRPIRGAAVDSRRVQPGNLFVALPGERTDGHEHLAEAVANGAAALLVSRPGLPADVTGSVSVIRVVRPVDGLGAIAAGWRRRFEPLTVGITGSLAKTSTKEAVAAVLAVHFRTLSSEGNENNEIGLPLTVLRLDRGVGALVLEMGMYVGGEIAELARIGQPRIGVVTAVQPVHLARIGTIEAVEAAKAELVEALPANGTAVLNADDERVARMAGRTSARVVTYGFGSGAEVTAGSIESAGVDGMRFVLRTPAGERAIGLPSLGRHAVHNALAAAAVGGAAGLDLDEITTGLAVRPPATHRGDLIRLGEVTIFDDSYNAAPASMRAALAVLASLPGRRVAVLGEMLELGTGHEAGHLEVGAAAAAVADLLIVVGPGAEPIGRAARAAGLSPSRVIEVADRQAALDALLPRLADNDVVLVKASRGIALDQLVDELRVELEL